MILVLVFGDSARANGLGVPRSPRPSHPVDPFVRVLNRACAAYIWLARLVGDLLFALGSYEHRKDRL